MSISAFTVKNIPLVSSGDDIALLIINRTDIEDHDIIVISSTIVSKSENRTISLRKLKITPKAESIAKKNSNDPGFVQAVLDESEEILLESPFLLVRTRNGSICVNAGIDRSNVEGSDNIILLPEDSDKSAQKIRDTISAETGKRVSVIINDTNGRAFRIGQTGAAIGIAGILPTRDWRGTKDLFGRVLEVKNEAIVDEIAGFANLLMGEGDGGTPVVIIRGLHLYEDSFGIKDLYRPKNEDVIRRALLRFQSV